MAGKYKHKLTGEIYEVIERKKDLFMRCIFSETNKSNDYFLITESWNKFNHFEKIEI
jgi:hypothetical protein